MVNPLGRCFCGAIGLSLIAITVVGASVLTFAVGIISAPFVAVGGVPCLAYRKYKLNQAMKALPLVDPGLLVGGKAFRDINVKFSSEEDLKNLKEYRPKLAAHLDAKSDELTAREKFEKVKLVVSVLAWTLIPFIGMLIAVASLAPIYQLFYRARRELSGPLTRADLVLLDRLIKETEEFVQRRRECQHLLMLKKDVIKADKRNKYSDDAPGKAIKRLHNVMQQVLWAGEGDLFLEIKSFLANQAPHQGGQDGAVATAPVAVELN